MVGEIHSFKIMMIGLLFVLHRKEEHKGFMLATDSKNRSRLDCVDEGFGLALVFAISKAEIFLFLFCLLKLTLLAPDTANSITKYLRSLS
jgi:hypothetical protein